MSETSAATRTVMVEREITHPPEKIWRALTQPHLISEWLMKNDFSPVVGHRFNLRGEWGGVLDCEVLIVESQRMLSYTWNFKHDEPLFDLNSVVTFSLSPTATGTHLRMEQSGFRPDQKLRSGTCRSLSEPDTSTAEKLSDPSQLCQEARNSRIAKFRPNIIAGKGAMER